MIDGMPLRCAVLDDYQGAAMDMADWSRLDGRVDIVVFRERIEGEDALVDALREFDIIVAMRERTPFRAPLLERLPRLRLLVTTGMRNAAIDVSTAVDRGVTVCGTASLSEPPVELTWALILGLARNLINESNALRAAGPWQSTVGFDLADKTLGLLGLGKIGGRVARVGTAFGMNVLAWSENLTMERAQSHGARLGQSMEQVLAESDVVSVHLILSRRTRGLLDAVALRQMRPTAFLINTSRAPIIDRSALIEALEQGWIAGAGLDVFDIEPLPADDPLRRLPNVLATPHLGYVTRTNYQTYFREAVEDIDCFLVGSPIRELRPAGAR
jgi:phosphoglycerate dehydrogenase-like enzyme